MQRIEVNAIYIESKDATVSAPESDGCWDGTEFYGIGCPFSPAIGTSPPCHE